MNVTRLSLCENVQAPVEEGQVLGQLEVYVGEQLRQAIAVCLTDQERQVIRLRYGLDGHPPKRQREVANATGISRSYVSRIEKRALEKLRSCLEP